MESGKKVESLKKVEPAQTLTRVLLMAVGDDGQPTPYRVSSETGNQINGTPSVIPVTQGGTSLATLTDGAFLIGNGTGAVQLVGPGPAGQIPISQGAGADPIMRTLSNDVTLDSAGVATIAAGAVDYSMMSSANITSLQRKNRLRNPAFKVAQRGTSFTSTTTPANNDDTYLLDGWYMLTDGNDVFDVTQQLDGDEYEIRLDVETINKKGGIAQIIEYKDCQDIIAADGTVTFSFQAKVSSTTKLDNIKAAILSWSSTADTVTSDFVSAWDSEGVQFTPAANWTLENTPLNLGVTTSYATYSVSAAIDTVGAKNVAVIIWSDVTDTTAGDFIHIRRCQFELGTTATPFEFRPFQQELALCQRYCWKLEADNTGERVYIGCGVVESTTTTSLIGLVFPVPMRTNPALTPAPTASDFDVYDGTAATAASALALTSSVNTTNCLLTVTHGALGANRPAILFGDTTAARSLTFDAEL